MEYQANPKENYIVIDAYFSLDAIKFVKELVAKRFENRIKTDFYQDFINWTKAENEILLGTFRPYTSWPLGADLGCVFNYRNPEEFVYQDSKLLHSLVNGWVPAESTSIGNNHIIALKFESQIPEIFFKLHEENEYRHTAPVGCFQLGLCPKEDFAIILENSTKRRLKSESH